VKIVKNNLYEIKNLKFSIDYKQMELGNIPPIEHFHDAYEIDFFIKADIKVFIGDNQYHIDGGGPAFYQ
jgi:hypothetical protein